MTSWLSQRGGGVPAAMLPLAAALRRRNVATFVLGLRDGPTPEGAIDVPIVGPRSLGFAPGLTAKLRAADAAIAHLHGIWMFPSIAVLQWSSALHRPRVISPHGMLDPWALKGSSRKKKLAMALFERRNLAGAACLHALNLAEAEAIRAFGLRNPIAVIPNGVELPDRQERYRRPAGKNVLFLGRIHPKKGLVELLTAWAKAAVAPSAADWRLVVAGWDDGGHLPGLLRQAAELGISDKVRFIGPVFGDAKARAFQEADALILPSFSEGLPMAVLEAWAYGLPVLMTRQCNIPEGFAAGAALPIASEPGQLAASLRDLLTRPTADLVAMGEVGKRLVEDRFTWNRVAAEMHHVYTWVLGGGTPPPCVLID